MERWTIRKESPNTTHEPTNGNGINGIHTKRRRPATRDIREIYGSVNTHLTFFQSSRSSISSMCSICTCIATHDLPLSNMYNNRTPAREGKGMNDLRPLSASRAEFAQAR